MFYSILIFQIVEFKKHMWTWIFHKSGSEGDEQFTIKNIVPLNYYLVENCVEKSKNDLPSLDPCWSTRHLQVSFFLQSLIKGIHWTIMQVSIYWPWVTFLFEPFMSCYKSYIKQVSLKFLDYVLLQFRSTLKSLKLKPI